MLLLLVIVSLGVSTVAPIKGRSACSVVYDGCNIARGRCVCARSPDRCYSPYSYVDSNSCRHHLFNSSLPDLPHHYPVCKSAQLRPICSARHVATKYCHGSCDKGCCVIGADGCLPPTNIFVPSAACARADQDMCKGYVCTKGYRCTSVRGDCRVLPCKKIPKCIVDDDYDPCPMVICSQERVCVKKRTNCKDDTCPFTYNCIPLADLIPVPNRIGCPSCPRLSLQERFCKNHFTIRVKVEELIWKKRWFKSLGISNWYSVQVEYIMKEQVPRDVGGMVLGNATLLLPHRPSGYCSCLNKIHTGERYMIVGKKHPGLAGIPQMLSLPSSGLVKSWQTVRRRPGYFLNVPNVHDCGI